MKVFEKIKKHKIASILLGVIFMMFLAYFGPHEVGLFYAKHAYQFHHLMHSNKITDPSDPRFDPTKFHFEDYERHYDPKTGHEGEIEDAVMAICKTGTPIEALDKAFVKSGGAIKIEERRKGDLYNRYNYRPWYIKAIYSIFETEAIGGAGVPIRIEVKVGADGNVTACDF